MSAAADRTFAVAVVGGGDAVVDLIGMPLGRSVEGLPTRVGELYRLAGHVSRQSSGNQRPRVLLAAE